MSRPFNIHELPEHQIGLHTLLMEVHYKPYIAYGDHIQNLKNVHLNCLFDHNARIRFSFFGIKPLTKYKGRIKQCKAA